jgi:hypothetical protein
MTGKELETIQNRGVEDVQQSVDEVNRFDRIVEITRRLSQVRSKRREVLDLFRVLSHEQHILEEQLQSELEALSLEK